MQRNIAAFGGDPRRVTVFGQSSGADNVCGLLASPLAAGLFSAAIMESPYSRCEAPTIARYETDVGISNVARMGCADAPDVVACLQSLPVLSVLKNQIPGNTDLRPRFYTQITDGYVLPESPIVAINNKHDNLVPFIIGSTAAENAQRVAAIPDAAAYSAAITARYGSALLNDILARYPLSNYPSPKKAFIQLTTDEVHGCPARRVALAATKPGIYVDAVDASGAGHSRVHRFLFTQIAESEPSVAPLGAFHTLDCMYLFAGWNHYIPSASEIALSNAMRSYWSSMAFHGSPNYDGGVAWQQMNVENTPFLELGPTIQGRQGDGGMNCDFWDAVGGYQYSRSQDLSNSERPFYTVDETEAL